jgi:alanyl-tRNA synthetase
MQQHTGQHLLSAVVEELFGWKTVSVHMGAEGNTVDVDAASVTEDQLARAERRCFEIISQSRPVTIAFEENAAGLRKESQRTGTLRVVSIDGIDRSACGGTHVRSTAEIGLVLTGKTEKIRGITRIEFACGARALARARNDNQRLAAISRTLSVAPEQAPDRIAALADQNKALDKERQRLATELARREGQELYAATPPHASGIRRARLDGSIDEATRTRAQAFTANPKAVFLAVSTSPAAVLFAASQDSGIHAGEKMTAALAAAGGRGGGNAQLAQGSVPDAASLEKALALLQ